MKRLVAVKQKSDIFEKFRDTPVGMMLEYHNLNKPFETYTKAQLLVGMCMDNRKFVKLPDNYAYVIRTGGGNLRYSEFKVSYAIAIGGVTAIALFAHNNCGMVNIMSKQEDFINNLVKNAGWDAEWAKEHFDHFAPMFEIGNEIDFVLSETKRLNLRYPKILVAPLYYNVDDNMIYQIEE
jgi:carbonic anhydrase